MKKISFNYFQRNTVVELLAQETLDTIYGIFIFTMKRA